MIKYTLIWMGPISLSWYEERNLNPDKDACCCGRIEIRGLSENEYYMGEHEYFVPPMKKSSWIKLNEFLEELKSNDLLEYEEIIILFEEQNGKIEWIK